MTRCCFGIGLCGRITPLEYSMLIRGSNPPARRCTVASASYPGAPGYGATRVGGLCIGGQSNDRLIRAEWRINPKSISSASSGTADYWPPARGAPRRRRPISAPRNLVQSLLHHVEHDQLHAGPAAGLQADDQRARSVEILVAPFSNKPCRRTIDLRFESCIGLKTRGKLPAFCPLQARRIQHRAGSRPNASPAVSCRSPRGR